MVDGSLDMKDTVGPGLVGTGFTLTLTPAMVLQIVGLFIAVIGMVFTYLRWSESKRYNNLYEERLNWEKENASAKDVQTETQTDKS